ncbi:MAG: GYD domain-containing protein [Chloroflexota bacterium]
MPRYMVQFAYSPEAWTSLVRHPQNRSEGLDAMLREFGAHLVDMYFYYGEWDGFVIIEAPDDTSFVASLLAGNAPGHLKATKVSRLYTADENLEIMRRASAVGYQGPPPVDYMELRWQESPEAK